MMRILLVATRDPYGRLSGRRAVLRTIVDSAQRLGHEIRVVAITNEPTVPGPAAVERLRPPRLPRILANVLTHGLTGRLCLNECLYVSPALRRSVARTAAAWPADVVVADMVRTASLALATGRPVIVDLDDLLSRRYQEMSRVPATDANLLGYYGPTLPAPVRGLLSWVAARLVAVEARLVARRELWVGRRAQAVSLVAEAEAADFQRQVGRPVAWLPMAVAIPPAPAPVATNRADRLVFVGGLDYQPNLDAVRHYVREVAPALAAKGRPDLRLRVVGHCPPGVRAELEGAAAIELVGFVDDLVGELAAARAFVAPIPPGTGIKTKVLEAMASGLPVVATPAAVEGIGVAAGESCLVAASSDDLAESVLALVADAGLAERLGLAGRSIVAERFSPAVVTERWRAVLDEVHDGQAGAR